MNKLSCLVYTSFRKPNCDEQELQNILKSCQNNNKPKGITGVLLHSKSRFLQYLEGDETQIVALYNKIKEDPRHASVTQRDLKKIDKRVFPSWAMAHKEMSSENIAYDSMGDPGHKQLLEKLMNDKLDFKNEGMKVLQLFFKTN
ncbi:MAG: BLUF domain-containing protein [Cyclobacteriaceae bacterium]